MKKNIKDYIRTKTAIWIDAHTIEQENAIKDLLIAYGGITRWVNKSALKELSYLSDYTKEQGYCLSFYNVNTIVRDTKKYYERQGYQIIPASEFLQPEFEYGEDIEVSDYEDFPVDMTHKRKYITTLQNGKVVSFTEDKEHSLTWCYARKINHERIEAIRMIKELMQKLNISKDEIS